MCLLYSAHRVKYETEINNSCFIKNKAVHTKLQSDFFRFFLKFDFHNVRILDVDSSTNKSDVLLRYCLQQTFLCNILQLRPVNGIVMMVINRCGCTMFHYVVTSKTLHIGFSFSVLQSGLPVFHSSSIDNQSDGCAASITQITYQILDLRYWLSFANISEEEHTFCLILIAYPMCKRMTNISDRQFQILVIKINLFYGD